MQRTPLDYPLGLRGLVGRHRLPSPFFGAGGTAGVTPSGPSETVARGFPPAPLGEAPPGSLREAAAQVWVRRIVDTVNNTLRGKLNAILGVTLAASADHTTIIDPRIGAFSALLFTPMSADAATEQASGHMYVSSQGYGTATVAHTNNSQSDRSFNMVIIG